MANKYPTTFATRRAELAKIHMAAEQLGMDTVDKDEGSTYRSMLWTVARVRSAAGLDWAGRKKVLDHLVACDAKLGFEGKPQSRALADDPQSKKIRALWLELHQAEKVRNPSESALAAFVKRETGVAALQWLKPAQASQVIERLKQWLLRADKKAQDVQ